jgi:ribonuclease D
MTFRIARERSLHVVDTTAALRDLQRWLLPAVEQAPMALDIEEDREFAYRPQVALIQLTVQDQDIILDPLRLPQEPLTELIEVLCLSADPVVMHGCNNDVTGLKRDFDVGPHRVLDTQVAARFLGITGFGLAPLLQARFDIALNKSVRRSDWRQRPLTHDMLDYARQDTAWLLPLAHELLLEVDRSGWRDAVEEECEVLANLRADGPWHAPDGWKKLKGLAELDTQGKVRVRALWVWRQRFAAARDLHPARAVAPWLILQLAQRGEAGLRSAPPRWMNSLTGDERAELVEVLRNPQAPGDAPSSDRRDRNGARRSDGVVGTALFQARVTRLTQWRDDTARAMDLETGWLLPRGLLEGLAKVAQPTHASLREVDGIRDWRMRRFADAWIDILLSP